MILQYMLQYVKTTILISKCVLSYCQMKKDAYMRIFLCV